MEARYIETTIINPESYKGRGRPRKDDYTKKVQKVKPAENKVKLPKTNLDDWQYKVLAYMILFATIYAIWGTIYDLL